MTTPSDVIQSRIDNARAILDELSLDGLLISDPDNRFYYSGFTAQDHGMTESAGVLLLDRTNQVLMTGANEMDWAQTESAMFEIVKWERPVEKSIASQIESMSLAKIGFEPHSLSYGSWSAISKVLEQTEFVPLGSQLDELRWVKDQTEITALQRAIDLTDKAYVEARSRIRGGQSEREIARMIEALFLEYGADGAAFSTIVASGPNASRPHHAPGDRTLTEGDVVIIDMGALVAGYCGDLTRTLFVGDVSDEAKRIYNAVAESQSTALATIRAGVPNKEVDEASREVFASHGFQDLVIHSLGHGLGIRVHDGPSVSIKSEQILESGNVLTIEPGLYVPGKLGVRIEDDVVVEDDGYKLLSHAPKEMFSIPVNGKATR